MATTDERVMKTVEAELSKNPNATSNDLFEKAKKIGPGVARLSRRQFHARYVLQVKRRRNRVRGRSGFKTGGGGKSTGGRDRREEGVRQVFLQFAQDVAGADGKDLIVVISKIDSYIADALRFSGR